MFPITFFKASVPLTKSYTKTTKTSYPNVYEVTSIEEQCKDMRHFAVLLSKHAAAGHCLVKGNPTRHLVNESRAGTTDRNAATEWIVFDVDGLPGLATPDDFMAVIGFSKLSYVVQWSASYGITNKDLRCHIFVKLDKPMAATLVKQWLIQLNHSISTLNNAMGLTKTGNAPLWALDVTACQNDKLLYIAPPLLKGIPDPMGKSPRIKYVHKQEQTLSIAGTINTTEQNKDLTHKRVNELRASNGFPVRKFVYKMHGSQEVMAKPDVCTITETKMDRGYVYFNLNGGDSWAYYHPEDNPTYIHNFKGEPVYLTKELLPEYWNEITQSATRISSSGIAYLALCDRQTGTYWRGTYDGNSNKLELYQAKNETQVRHFAKQHGVPLGEYIAEWDLVFDPNDIVRVDHQNKVINTFEPTIYMMATNKKVIKCPPTIYKVIDHALGGDKEITERFINWLAFIIQNRTMAKTAWILNGTTGTGKGLLMHKILRPLFGSYQTAFKRAEELNEQFNEFVKNKLMVMIDEVEAKIFQNEKSVMSKLKNFVTEPSISIRAMYASSVDCTNYSNWIFSSNKPDPLVIDKEDRRFNVGKYQPNKLIIPQAEIDDVIPKELQGFYDYLANYDVDINNVRTPMNSEDRLNMMTVSESSIDSVSSALLSGDFAYFIDALPTSDAYKRNAMELNRVEAYREVLKTILDNTDERTGKCSIARDDLRILYDYTVGGMPTTPNKFTSLLKHHRVHITKIRIGDETPRGIVVTWTKLAQMRALGEVLNPPAPPVKHKLKVVVNK